MLALFDLVPVVGVVSGYCSIAMRRGRRRDLIIAKGHPIGLTGPPMIDGRGPGNHRAEVSECNGVIDELMEKNKEEACTMHRNIRPISRAGQ